MCVCVCVCVCVRARLTESCCSLFLRILDDHTLTELWMCDVLNSQKVRLSMINAWGDDDDEEERTIKKKGYI